MVSYVEIGGKKYPFYFGMREVFAFSSKSGAEFDEVDGKIAIDYDAFLELYEIASARGAKKDKSELVLTKDELEDAIDESPYLFMELQKIFENSKAIKSLKSGELGNQKKSPKG